MNGDREGESGDGRHHTSHRAHPTAGSRVPRTAAHTGRVSWHDGPHTSPCHLTYGTARRARAGTSGGPHSTLSQTLRKHPLLELCKRVSRTRVPIVRDDRRATVSHLPHTLHRCEQAVSAVYKSQHGSPPWCREPCAWLETVDVLPRTCAPTCACTEPLFCRIREPTGARHAATHTLNAATTILPCLA